MENNSGEVLSNITNGLSVPVRYSDDVVEVAPEDRDYYININTVTPLSISTHAGSVNFATMNFLCTFLRSDIPDLKCGIVILTKNYIAESEDELDICKTLPFFTEDEFCSRKICDHVLFDNIPRIITELDMSIESENDLMNDCAVLSCGRLLTEDSSQNQRNNIQIKFGLDQFSAISFIDNYIINGDINEYDLSLATAVGSKDICKTKELHLFAVDDIVSIVSMCRAEKKSKNIFKNIFKKNKKEESTSIGLVFKVMRYIDGKKEIVSLLTPFDLQVSLPDSKFKGDSISSLEEKYYGDADQYVSTLFIENMRIKGIDKEYMIIRGKNKDHKVFVFLLDVSITDKLTKLIEQY